MTSITFEFTDVSPALWRALFGSSLWHQPFVRTTAQMRKLRRLERLNRNAPRRLVQLKGRHRCSGR